MLKVGDKVRVLPNKKDGVVTEIINGFWVILDNEQSRPYMPMQVKKIEERKEEK